MPSTLIYRELFGFYRKLSVSKTSSHSATGKEKNLNSKSFALEKNHVEIFFFFKPMSLDNLDLTTLPKISDCVKRAETYSLQV